MKTVRLSKWKALTFFSFLLLFPLEGRALEFDIVAATELEAHFVLEGASLYLEGHLKSEDGTPLALKNLGLYLGNDFLLGFKSGRQGAFKKRLPQGFIPKDKAIYHLRFLGTAHFLSSERELRGESYAKREVEIRLQNVGQEAVGALNASDGLYTPDGRAAADALNAKDAPDDREATKAMSLPIRLQDKPLHLAFQLRDRESQLGVGGVLARVKWDEGPMLLEKTDPEGMLHVLVPEYVYAERNGELNLHVALLDSPFFLPQEASFHFQIHEGKRLTLLVFEAPLVKGKRYHFQGRVTGAYGPISDEPVDIMLFSEEPEAQAGEAEAPERLMRLKSGQDGDFYGILDSSFHAPQAFQASAEAGSVPLADAGTGFSFDTTAENSVPVFGPYVSQLVLFEERESFFTLGWRMTVFSGLFLGLFLFRTLRTRDRSHAPVAKERVPKEGQTKSELGLLPREEKGPEKAGHARILDRDSLKPLAGEVTGYLGKELVFQKVAKDGHFSWNELKGEDIRIAHPAYLPRLLTKEDFGEAFLYLESQKARIVRLWQASLEALGSQAAWGFSSPRQAFQRLQSEGGLTKEEEELLWEFLLLLEAHWFFEKETREDSLLQAEAFERALLALSKGKAAFPKAQKNFGGEA